jgi:hypothetical protein
VAIIGTSQNGWPVSENRAEIGVATFVVPGYPNVKLPLQRDAAPVMLDMARWWFRNIEPPVMPGCWGYAFRAIRGQTSGYSNHASGTGMDLNAPEHPLGAYGTVPAAKRAAISAAARARGLRWGGDYSGRKDEMHFEVVVTRAEVAALARALLTPPKPQIPTEVDVKNLKLARSGDDPAVYVGDGIRCRHVRSQAELENLQWWMGKWGADSTIHQFEPGAVFGVLGVPVEWPEGLVNK